MSIFKVTPRLVHEHFYVKADSPEEAVEKVIWDEMPSFEWKFGAVQSDVINMLTEHSCVGDLVQCTWCGKRMLVNLGEDVCPACNTEGTLSWIEGCPQEVQE